MKKSIIVLVIIGISVNVMGYGICALDREQDEIYDFVKLADILGDEEPPLKHSHSFFTYFWRIASAPLVVMFTFPFDEETDIYSTYLEYVNKGTDRQWRKKEFSINDRLGTETGGNSESISEENTQ
ncbi:MAG: hypothetical protein JW938_07190 [Candidatus Omnitrophica bacterium]|nr:hypothetical protein [Candidatus Omnitrophota bacterium]